jgi:ribonuclease PH
MNRTQRLAGRIAIVVASVAILGFVPRVSPEAAATSSTPPQIAASLNAICTTRDEGRPDPAWMRQSFENDHCSAPQEPPVLDGTKANRDQLMAGLAAAKQFAAAAERYQECISAYLTQRMQEASAAGNLAENRVSPSPHHALKAAPAGAWRPAVRRTHMRPSRRQSDELRPVSLERGVVKFAEGSCFVKFGETHVLVTATLEDRLPPWLKGQGRGWITAEYGMLPRATLERTRREASAGKQSGRTVEIQRLIGRSLRSVVDLKALGERQITIDCDVIQADGGTRTASITGAWIALYDCIAWMKTRDMVQMEVLRDHIAAISCGVHGGVAVLDLDYAEDSQADTDANFVLTGTGNIVEIQATAEKTPFSEAEFAALLALARKGIAKLVDLQKMAVM